MYALRLISLEASYSAPIVRTSLLHRLHCIYVLRAEGDPAAFSMSLFTGFEGITRAARLAKCSAWFNCHHPNGIS